MSALKHRLDQEPRIMLACEQLGQFLSYWSSDSAIIYLIEPWKREHLINCVSDILVGRLSSYVLGHPIVEAQLENFIEYFGVLTLLETIELLNLTKE